MLENQTGLGNVQRSPWLCKPYRQMQFILRSIESLLSATIACFTKHGGDRRQWAKLAYSSDSPPKGSNDQRKLEGNQEPKILPRFLIRWRGKGHLGLYMRGFSQGGKCNSF